MCVRRCELPWVPGSSDPCSIPEHLRGSAPSEPGPDSREEEVSRREDGLSTPGPAYFPEGAL